MVVADIDGDGDNELLVQANVAPNGLPGASVFKSYRFTGAELLEDWQSDTVNATNVFAAGGALNDGKIYLLFVVEGEAQSVVFALDRGGTTRELFALPGEIRAMEVADLDGDGINEMIAALITEQHDDLASGEIRLFRWTGGRAVEVTRLQPERSGGIGAFEDMRAIDVAPAPGLEIVVEEVTHLEGSPIRAFAYDKNKGVLAPVVDRDLARGFAHAKTANLILWTSGGRRLLIFGAAGRVEKYSLEEGVPVSGSDIANPFVTAGLLGPGSELKLVVTSVVLAATDRPVRVRILDPEAF